MALPSTYRECLDVRRPESAPGDRLPLSDTLRVVALGGGTGLGPPLRGLKEALFQHHARQQAPPNRDRLTAIVTMADDGGSSGRLRRAYRVLPPGDIRNCLLALSDADATLQSVFDFRFRGGAELAGHSLGNLILTALAQGGPDFPAAVDRAAELLRIRGRVLPSTRDSVVLVAEFEDGTRITGESRIALYRKAVRRVWLEPKHAAALPEAVQAIEQAHLVVLGPGSLYTSILPALLVRGIAEALGRSQARVVLVANLMTEPGETDGYTAADIVRALQRHAPRVPIHVVLLNSAPISSNLKERYAGDGAQPMEADRHGLRALGCQPLTADLLAPGRFVRHDAQRTARALMALASWQRLGAANGGSRG